MQESPDQLLWMWSVANVPIPPGAGQNARWRTALHVGITVLIRTIFKCHLLNVCCMPATVHINSNANVMVSILHIKCWSSKRMDNMQSHTLGSAPPYHSLGYMWCLFPHLQAMLCITVFWEQLFVSLCSSQLGDITMFFWMYQLSHHYVREPVPCVSVSCKNTVAWLKTAYICLCNKYALSTLHVPGIVPGVECSFSGPHVLLPPWGSFIHSSWLTGFCSQRPFCMRKVSDLKCEAWKIL